MELKRSIVLMIVHILLGSVYWIYTYGWGIMLEWRGIFADYVTWDTIIIYWMLITPAYYYVYRLVRIFYKQYKEFA